MLGSFEESPHHTAHLQFLPISRFIDQIFMDETLSFRNPACISRSLASESMTLSYEIELKLVHGSVAVIRHLH